MKKILVVSNESFFSTTFSKRFKDCEVEAVHLDKLSQDVFRTYDVAVIDVPAEKIQDIRKPLEILHKQLGTPIVMITDCFFSKDAHSLCGIENMPIFVKPVDTELVVSIVKNIIKEI